MLSVHGRKPAAVVVEPVARGFLKVGLTPNAVTLIGTFVTIAITVTLIPSGHLLPRQYFPESSRPSTWSMALWRV